MNDPTIMVLMAALDVVRDLADERKPYDELVRDARTAINDVAVVKGVPKLYPNG